MRHYIFGDYVLTGIKNAFNKKMSFWMSKKDIMISVYCFSIDGNPATNVEAKRDFDYHVENIDSYKNLFELQLKKLSTK